MSWSVDEQQVHKHLYIGSKPNPDIGAGADAIKVHGCLLYTSPSPRDRTRSRMPSSA